MQFKNGIHVFIKVKNQVSLSALQSSCRLFHVSFKITQKTYDVPMFAVFSWISTFPTTRTSVGWLFVFSRLKWQLTLGTMSISAVASFVVIVWRRSFDNMNRSPLKQLIFSFLCFIGDGSFHYILERRDILTEKFLLRISVSNAT